MNVQRYRICNLLNYQVDQIKKILNEDTITIIENFEQPHFSDIFVGLNPTEYSILIELGYCLTKHVPVGESLF